MLHDLKPCPFCGTELYAEYVQSGIDEGRPYRFIHPVHDTCPLSKRHFHPNRMYGWNIRVENNV